LNESGQPAAAAATASPRRGATLAAAIGLIYALILALALSGDWPAVWRLCGVQGLSHSFGDLRSVTGATVTMAAGRDPLVDNIGDPWHRPANYPRVWFRAAQIFHVGPDDTVPIGLFLAALFVAGMGMLGARLVRGRSDFVLMCAIALAPSTLAAIERGNIDIVVFAVVCAAIASSARVWVTTAALAAGAILKLFPVFALIVPVLRRPRQAWRPALVWAVLLVALGVAYLDDLRLIKQTVPVNPFGYGVPSLALDIRLRTHGLVGATASAVLALAEFAAAVGTGAVLAWRFGPVRRGPTTADLREDAFLIAGAIFAGTFLLSSNFPYRLIFLIPAVPFLNALRRSAAVPCTSAGAAGLTALAIVMSQELLIRLLGPHWIAVAVAAHLVLLAVLAFGAWLIVRGDRGWKGHLIV
jgi:hypothetical protein